MTRYIGMGFVALIAIQVAVRADGPDVVVAAITDVTRWARIGDVTAYSVGTIACNSGTIPIEWYGATNHHPVIAQNMYRYRDGRFEQIGQSWIKHGFAAETETYCGGCIDPDSSFLLGVSCSDTYRAQLNGRQLSLTPRSIINPATGVFPFPLQQPPPTTELDRRMQVRDADLIHEPGEDSAYFLEGIYVAADDAAAGNNMNNASTRRAFVAEDPPGSRNFTVIPIDVTMQGRSAIDAWSDLDPSISVVNIDHPGDGRIQVGASVTDLGNGTWRYEYAIANVNSDRCVGGLSLAFASDAVVRSTRFHDVDTHSGEPMGSGDWQLEIIPGMTSWFTKPYADSPNGNAIRWGTLYNFTIDLNSPPVLDAAITITYFKPGDPKMTTLSFLGPSTLSPDCNSNGIPDSIEVQNGIASDCNHNEIMDACEYISCPGLMSGDPDCDGQVTLSDVKPFVHALLFGGSACQTDVDRDGAVNGRDISLFVYTLAHPN